MLDALSIFQSDSQDPHKEYDSYRDQRPEEGRGGKCGIRPETEGSSNTQHQTSLAMPVRRR